MDEPKITKIPTEIFGYAYTDHSEHAKRALREQYCPFLDGECKKPRKSNPKVKIGACSVGYNAGVIKKHQPVVICPHRLDTPIIFHTIEQQYLRDWPDVEWIREVSIGVGGSVDYVAINRDNTGKIKDFLCVEFQAAGTTGTPWEAILEFKENREFKSTTYNYGINWANEFVKTMMQQVFKKGKIIEYWKHKIIFVVQDVGMDYIKYATDASGIRAADPNDPIHFCTFRLVWKDTKWAFEFVERVSTDLDGINKILGGALEEEYPSVVKFVENIERKVTQALKK